MTSTLLCDHENTHKSIFGESKVGIVVPLKASNIATGWQRIRDNLNEALRSVGNQVDQRYELIVVGEDRPAGLSFPQGKGEFLALPAPLPSEITNRASTGDTQLSDDADRCAKVQHGIRALKKKYNNISHWFVLDTDDILHESFIAEIIQNANSDAIILDKSHASHRDSERMQNDITFSAFCGSSAVLSDRLFDDDNDFRSIPFRAISHVRMKEQLMVNGFRVMYLMNAWSSR